MYFLLLFFVLDFFLLQPVRCFIGFFNRFLWHPVEYIKDKEYDLNADLEKISNDALKKYDWESLLHSNDCCKFLGIYLSLTKDEKKLAYVKSLLDKENKTFKRQNYEYDKEVDFSTDMLPGLMMILYHYPNLWEKEELKEVIDNISFNKIPFDFPNGNGDKVFKRGWFFNPFIVWTSHNILTTLSWLALCKHLFNDWKYTILYYTMLILYSPSLLFACPIGNVQLPKFGLVGTAWHQIHSKMIIYCIGYSLTKNIIFKLSAKRIYKLHKKFNPEIVGLYYKYILNKKIDKNSDEYIDCYDAILSCNDKATLDSSDFPTKTYRDIRSLFKETTMLTKMHSCLYRNEEYQWERNPQKKQSMLDSNYRKKHRLDVYNAIKLLG